MEDLTRDIQIINTAMANIESQLWTQNATSWYVRYLLLSFGGYILLGAYYHCITCNTYSLLLAISLICGCDVA